MALGNRTSPPPVGVRSAIREVSDRHYIPAREATLPDHRPPTINTTEARQGETSGRMRRVLGLSLASVVIVFALVLIWWVR
jgi:hypothetical protein